MTVAPSEPIGAASHHLAKSKGACRAHRHTVSLTVSTPDMPRPSSSTLIMETLPANDIRCAEELRPVRPFPPPRTQVHAESWGLRAQDDLGTR